MKHEKAILIFLAYIIGFITAFIAFAINDAGQEKKESFKPAVAQGEQSAMVSKSIDAMVTDDGLYVVMDGKERVLSAKMEMSEAEDGFHSSIVITSVSPNSKFVYYCAQRLASDSECASYVYSLANDVVYKVTTVDEVVTITADVADSVAWSRDGRLQINGMQSIAANTPWEVQ